MKAWLCVVLLCCTQLTWGQQDSKKIEDLIDDIFNKNDKFTTPQTNIGQPVTSKTTILSTPQPPVSDRWETKSCSAGQKCVTRTLCYNGAVNTAGIGLIDIRLGADEVDQCTDYISVCCNVDEIKEPPVTNNKQDQTYTCGMRNKDGIGYKIEGAVNNEAEYGEFPWMVAVLKDEIVTGETYSLYECGGSLITRSVVLTAAHCVQSKQAANLVVRAGEWDTQTKNEIYPHQDRRVKEIIVHENYNKGSLFNDIALLITDSPFDYDENVRPACLPGVNDNFDHERCFASGWGKDKFGKEGKYQVILKKVELPVVPKNTCQDQLRKTRLGKFFILDKSFICAGGEAGVDTCKGDGGSPLVCPIPHQTDQYYQAGIVAYGVGCGNKDVPGVYADVAYLRPWIDRQLQARKLDTSDYNP